MSQRESGYERKELDNYVTPSWVTKALLPRLPKPPLKIWEPAAGSGEMAKVLVEEGYEVIATDITTGDDFLLFDKAPDGVDAIVTNPPYTFAREFIERSMEMGVEIIALLLRADYDHAKTRANLFGRCPHFAGKLILTRRIIWFDSPLAAPSFNHCWFVWLQGNKGREPTLSYYVEETKGG